MTAVRAAFTLLARAIHAVGNATYPITVEPDLWAEFDSHADMAMALLTPDDDRLPVEG